MCLHLIDETARTCSRQSPSCSVGGTEASQNAQVCEKSQYTETVFVFRIVGADFFSWLLSHIFLFVRSNKSLPRAESAAQDSTVRFFLTKKARFYFLFIFFWLNRAGCNRRKRVVGPISATKMPQMTVPAKKRPRRRRKRALWLPRPPLRQLHR